MKSLVFINFYVQWVLAINLSTNYPKSQYTDQIKNVTHRDNIKIERGTSHKGTLDRWESDFENLKI